MSEKINPRKLIESPGHTLHRLVEQHMEETGEQDYTCAMTAVLRDPENLGIALEYQNWGRTLAGRRPKGGY